MQNIQDITITQSQNNCLHRLIAKYSSLQLTANCIAAIVNSAPFIQNSIRIAFSVHGNRKFSERILSTPTISKVTSKLFGSQGCSDDKNWLDLTFPAFSWRSVDFAAQFCFRCKFLFQEKPCQSSLTVAWFSWTVVSHTHNNQRDCFILIDNRLRQMAFSCSPKWPAGPRVMLKGFEIKKAVVVCFVII